MLAPSTDRPPPTGPFEPIPFRDPAAGVGGTACRPTWWLDDREHARLLGIKAGHRAIPARRLKSTAKPQAEPPPPTPEPTHGPAVADFSALAPTLTALDRVLHTPEFGAHLTQGSLPRRWSGRAGRFGFALGFATVMAALVFFR